MTVRPLLTLTCDSCGVQYVRTFDARTYRGRDVRARAAHAWGWSSYGRNDYCLACQQKGIVPNGAPPQREEPGDD